MKKLINILLLLVLLCSCENELANKAVTQDEKISSFIESRYAESPVIFNGGVNRIVLEEGDSTAFAAPGDIVDFTYVGYPFTTSIGKAFATGDYTGLLDENAMIKGLAYGMVGMCPGEKAYIIFSCKYGYNASVAGVGRDEALVFEVLLNEINPK